MFDQLKVESSTEYKSNKSEIRAPEGLSTLLTNFNSSKVFSFVHSLAFITAYKLLFFFFFDFHSRSNVLPYKLVDNARLLINFLSASTRVLSPWKTTFLTSMTRDRAPLIIILYSITLLICICKSMNFNHHILLVLSTIAPSSLHSADTCNFDPCESLAFTITGLTDNTIDLTASLFLFAYSACVLSACSLLECPLASLARSIIFSFFLFLYHSRVLSLLWRKQTTHWNITMDTSLPITMVSINWLHSSRVQWKFSVHSKRTQLKWIAFFSFSFYHCRRFTLVTTCSTGVQCKERRSKR